MTIRLELAASAGTRYATGAMMYFAQGIPAGLLAIALPAWLASRDVGAGAIASYLAVITLPWAFKLLSGPLMDRFQFLAMGRRRPWVLGAQLGLTLSLLSLALVPDPTQSMGMLMLFGTLVNVFAATQDVAVDGMAIDLTPVQEQGRLNAFMAFGKAVGWGASSAVCGLLLVNFGFAVTGLVMALVSALVLCLFLRVREHEGERLLPWSEGAAVAEARPPEALGKQLGALNRELWGKASIVLMLIMVCDGLVSGYGHALMPIAAVKLFGFSTPQWSQLVAMMGLIGAAAALALGPFIDRFGARTMLLLTSAMVGLHAFLLALTQHLWQDTLYVRVMLSVWILLGPMTMVCMIALAMALCAGSGSATRFAVYMSIANLGSSAGAKAYGLVAEGISYTESYLLLGCLVLLMLAVLALYRQHPADGKTRAGRPAPRYTTGIGAGEAGMFWSGAMRCPKCRADMEMTSYDGVEIDRCASCSGLWFDPGELEKLRSREAAAELDTGARRTGKRHDSINRYNCPRCGGKMMQMLNVDSGQVWYESCVSCHGSYLDAGELTALNREDLSALLQRLRPGKKATTARS
ncbi:MFS transporter [Haliea sp. E17]|uniref:MFS transporter n=1 Tax=Haliea sp. E17 TaxID=3401576 RepID=UPI003AAB93F9